MDNVVFIPVDTPAGGLVRVQRGNDEVLLDKSYTRGTASCTLEEKFRWAAMDLATRGPPPFSTPLKVPMEKLVETLGNALGVTISSETFAARERAKKKELQNIKKNGGSLKQFADALRKELPEEAIALAQLVIKEDRAAVAEAKAACK